MRNLKRCIVLANRAAAEVVELVENYRNDQLNGAVLCGRRGEGEMYVEVARSVNMPGIAPYAVWVWPQEGSVFARWVCQTWFEYRMRMVQEVQGIYFAAQKEYDRFYIIDIGEDPSVRAWG